MAFKTQKDDEFEDIVWSDALMSIRDVVYDGLPVVVRVAEGFYGENEAESFSRGDLLKLDFVKSIQKVYATIVSSWSEAILEDQSGYMQPDKEIVIPLGYKGKVLITRPPTEFKVYFTVEELLRDFPRFVRVDKEFFAQSNEDQAIKIEVGKKLELDRYLPAKGLVAYYETKTVVLNNSVRSRFVPLPDESEYTLSDVIDRLPMPQFVRFVEDEFQRVLTTDLFEAVENVQLFTGCVKLKRVFREEVVVGHHKPHIPEYMKKQHEKYVNRSIVLLPLGREAMNEIEVNVPIYSEPDEYELLVVRNFTQQTPNMDVVDGSLYLEFAKNPRSFYVLDDNVYNDDTDIGAAPPIPPRPLRPTEAPSRPPRHTSEEDYEQVDQPQDPPPVVPRATHQPKHKPTASGNPNKTVQQKRNNKPIEGKHLAPDTAQKHISAKPDSPGMVKKDTVHEQDGPLMIYEVEDGENDTYMHMKQKISVPKGPSSQTEKPFYKKLKRVQTELIKRFQHKHAPKQPNLPTVAVTQPLPSPTYDGKTSSFPSLTSASNYGKTNVVTATRRQPKPSESSSSTKPHGKPNPLTSTTLNSEAKKSKPITTPKQIGKTKPPNVDTSGNVGGVHATTRQKGKDQKLKKEKGTKTCKNDQNESDDDETSDDYDYPDVAQMIPPPLPQSPKRPIVRVQPSTRDPTTTTPTGISKMSVKDLMQCLTQCALPNLALLCNENAIDGKFLSELRDDELRDKPFSLNNIEIAKIKKMKEGWRPKLY